VAVKIRLKRMGKIRAPYYRIVVADARTKRDGRAIEEIGKYHPTHEPSVIEVKSERAQYWLSVGAQPTEQVLALLKVTGDWQKFKGLPGQEGTLRVAGQRVDDRSGFDEAKSLNENEAKTLKAKRGRSDDRPAAEARSEKPAAEAKAEKPAAEAKAEKPAAEAKAEKPAAKAEKAEAEVKAEKPAAEAKADKPAAAEKAAQDAEKPAVEEKAPAAAGVEA
jgi:small subunit ribosomal protein S16